MQTVSAEQFEFALSLGLSALDWIHESYDKESARSVATFVTDLYVWTQMLELQWVDSQELVIAIPQACADQYG